MNHCAPLVSIILPTKNRAELARRVATATLEDPSPNIELVIVDNDDTDATMRECKSINDPRVRVVRTGGLNMIQNWDRGFQEARGDIIVYIEDKVFLRNGAIRAIVHLFEDRNLDFITYPFQILDREDESLPIEKEQLPSIVLNCKDVCDTAIRCNLAEYHRIAPRTINTAVRRSFAQQAKGTSESIFSAVAPDYTSGARYLHTGVNYRHVLEPLACVLKGAPSIGRSSFEKGRQAEQFFLELGGSWESFLTHVPLPVPLLSNSLLNDLLGVWRNALSDSDSSIAPDLRDYYLLLGVDLAQMEETRDLPPPERAVVRQALKQHGFLFSVSVLLRAFMKLIKGWPNRRLRARENLPMAKSVLKSLGLFP